MTNKKEIFQYKDGCVLNKELGKLISYGYDLNERDFQRCYCIGIPTFKFESLNSTIPYGKKIFNGGIYGWRIYRDHSSDILMTQIGVFKQENDNLKSFFLDTNNYDYDTYSSTTKLIDGQNYFTYDNSNGCQRNITSEEFIEAMVILGFNEEDVIAVTEGKLTAKEAYRKVAPDDIKNIEWLDIGRRKYVFDGNVAISGTFSGIEIDKFPFPFDEQPIFDCSKVRTSYIKFGDNKRGAKLINVNENKASITGTDLRTAIIEEPIDLASVDATDTIFGHQVVIYPEMSIAPLNRINLALAIDNNGKKYVTDNKGHIINRWCPETEDVVTKGNSKKIKVFANADNKEMTIKAKENNAEGIGLVRTENVFSNCNINELKSFFRYYIDENDDALNILKELTKKQIEEILSTADKNRVIVRLLDFKFNEFLRLHNISLDELNMTKIPNTRGINGLWKNILKTQLEVLFQLSLKYNTELNILIPMVNDINYFKYIGSEIATQAKKFNNSKIKIGTMIENLYSIHFVDELVRKVDFISIGTNDLTENITGLSRDFQTLEFKLLSDNVKELILEIIYRARAIKPKIEIGICGEHMNYIENIDFLSNLNIDYITCHPVYVKTNQELIGNLQQYNKKSSQKTKKYK